MQMDTRHGSLNPTKTRKASGSGSHEGGGEGDTHPGTAALHLQPESGLHTLYNRFLGEVKDYRAELVYGKRDFPVVVSANISMYALGMLSCELEVPKLINCHHFHPVREDRQENS